MHVADFRCREAISGRALPVAGGDARRVAVVGAHWRFFRESKPFEKFFEIFFQDFVVEQPVVIFA